VLLLSAAPVVFIAALVLAGISAIFLSMPLKYQPGVTQLFVDVSAALLRYGPHPKPVAGGVLAAFSSFAILLACVPLFDALRSSGPTRLAAILLAPLALFSLMYLAQAGRYCLGFSGASSADVVRYGVYFWPEVLVRHIADLPARPNLSGSVRSAVLVEAAKWCIVLTIAVWLSIARLGARWQGKKTSTA
jgi:hypothetical protein